MLFIALIGIFSASLLARKFYGARRFAVLRLIRLTFFWRILSSNTSIRVSSGFMSFFGRIGSSGTGSDGAFV